jgi:hypothetical protein
LALGLSPHLVAGTTSLADLIIAAVTTGVTWLSTEAADFLPGPGDDLSNICSRWQKLDTSGSGF